MKKAILYTVIFMSSTTFFGQGTVTSFGVDAGTQGLETVYIGREAGKTVLLTPKEVYL